MPPLPIISIAVLWLVAVVITSAIYSVVHFLKPKGADIFDPSFLPAAADRKTN